jgi:hypothetical protein
MPGTSNDAEWERFHVKDNALMMAASVFNVQHGDGVCEHERRKFFL